MVQRRKSQSGAAVSVVSAGAPATGEGCPSGSHAAAGRTLPEGPRERCIIEIVDFGKRYMVAEAGSLGVMDGEGGT